MPLSHRRTLTHHLIEERRRFPQASGALNGLLLDIAVACKAIARVVSFGELGDQITVAPMTSVASVVREEFTRARTLSSLSQDIFLRINEWNGHTAGMVSQALPEPVQLSADQPRGKYLLVFNALEGSASTDLNVAVGSLFSILRAPQDVAEHPRDVSVSDFLQPGAQQVAAGYALYGPATMLVLSAGNGVSGFTLNHNLGEFVLTHPQIKVPERTQEFAINSANSRFWEPPVKRYVDECLAGKSGPRGKDFNMRWIASMAAEAHRILMHGGVFLEPRNTRDPKKPGPRRLLSEANPIGYLIEQAGGRASSGRASLLDIAPANLDQSVGLVFGSREEVERIEQYHRQPIQPDQGLQLFTERSLFRD
jgi:fructose-1,6-bisphosphatase I/sedoheptulose-1,7-bisphosphatase